MNRFVLALCVAAMAVATPSLGLAQGSASEFRGLSERIERLQRDLADLQRHVYAGAPPPARSDAAAPAGGESAAQLQVRLNAIDGQLRTLTGQVEEADHQARQIGLRLDKLVADVDLRLRALEERQPAAAPAPPGTDNSTSALAAPSAAAPPAPGAQITLRPPAAPATPAPAAPTGTLQVPAPRPPASGAVTPEAQYQLATNLLRDSKWAQAEAAFAGFVDQHPTHQLAGNAAYWLGETYFARDDYDRAAKAFARAYQQYPKSDKASANLLKMARSLAALNRTADACASLKKLRDDFPNPPGTIAREAQAEQKKLACR